jgi:hypothetical protein
MGYLFVNCDFSQFDRDNANRFHASGYLRSVNAIAKDVLDSPKAAAGVDDLRRADAEVGAAQAAMAGHDYPATFDHAKAAYDHVRAAAAAASVEVTVSTANWDVLPPDGPGVGRHDHRFDYAYVDDFGPGTHPWAD